MSAYQANPMLPARAASSATHLLLFPVAWVCFVGAAVTDGLYAKTESLMWLHFSEWLIAVGIAFGVLTAIALLVGRLAHRAESRWEPSGVHVALFLVALVIEIVNALVHTADGWTAIVPAGAALSAAGAILALASVVALGRSPGARTAGMWR